MRYLKRYKEVVILSFGIQLELLCLFFREFWERGFIDDEMDKMEVGELEIKIFLIESMKKRRRKFRVIFEVNINILSFDDDENVKQIRYIKRFKF